MEYQRPAFEQLLAVAKASLSINRSKLAIWPRTNTLIIGPSGTGKSFLARAVAHELDVPVLILNISEWILLGASERGATHTWPVIVDFLRDKKTADGGVIFLDEVDKLTGHCSWDTHLRNEIFSFLDQQIPRGLADDLGSKMEDAEIHQAQEVLENRIFIIVAGAFQSL